MELEELGRVIRQARTQSGLSQAHLARIAGVSRATVNYAEQGRSSLGAGALLRLISPLGLSLVTTPTTDHNTSLAVSLLASSASVSFKEAIPSAVVETALLSGVIDDRWLAHFARIVDESSDTMLLRAVREVSSTRGEPAARIWRNIVRIAETLASPHPRWA